MAYRLLLLRVLAASAVPVYSSPRRHGVPATEPPSPPAASRSAAAEIAKAQALFKAGRFEEALAILRPLAAAGPGHLDIRFQTGMAAIGASKKPDIAEAKREALLDEAIAAFRTMLIADPGLVRVRLELARAFFLKGEDTLATRHFEQVLAGKPPAPVVLNVNRFLSQMRARKRWSPAPRHGAGAGQQYLQPVGRSQTIVLDTPIGRLPFIFQAQDEAESGIGISVRAGGEYQYPLEDRWRLRAGADISRNEYRSGEFDQMTVSGHVGPRWLIGRASEASLLASVRQHWLSDEAEFRDLGIRVEVRHRLNRRMTASPRRFPARTPLRRTHASRRAAHRCLGGRRLGGDADGAYRHGGGLGEPEDGTRAPAPYAALGVARRHGAPSLGLHRGRGPARCAGPTTRPTGLHSSWAAGRAAT